MKKVLRIILRYFILLVVLLIAHFIGDVFFWENKTIYSSIFLLTGVIWRDVFEKLWREE